MSKRPRKRVTEIIKSKAVLKRSAEVLQRTKKFIIKGKIDLFLKSAAKRFEKTSSSLREGEEISTKTAARSAMNKQPPSQ